MKRRFTRLLASETHVFLSAVLRADGEEFEAFTDCYRWHPDEGWRTVERAKTTASVPDVLESIRLRLQKADFSEAASDSVLTSAILVRLLTDVYEHYLVLAVMTS